MTTEPSKHRLSPIEFAAIGAILFVAIAFSRGILTLAVEYQPAQVINVIQIPGADMSERLVIVDTGEHQRPIRTSDRLLRLQVGEIACISKRTIFLRRWQRYRLELPGYCHRPAAGAILIHQ